MLTIDDNDDDWATGTSRRYRQNDTCNSCSMDGWLDGWMDGWSFRIGTLFTKATSAALVIYPHRDDRF